MVNAPFKGGRMFVGWRRRDFKVVYYKPYEGDDPHDEKSGLVPSLYFTNALGEETSPMMEGEILFLPAFAYENCESKWKGEQKRMQHNTLIDSFMLYNEANPDVYKALMASKEDPTWPRWNSIMKDIRKFKDAKMKTQESRRLKRVAKAANLRRNGVTESELDKNMSSSDDDSGFDDDGDDEVRIHSRRSRPGPMNPPPTPRAPRKRGNGSNGNNGNNDDDDDDDHNDNDDSQPKTKKRKPAARKNLKDLQMSGSRTNGDRNGRSGRSPSLGYTGIVDRSPSMDYDASPPERGSMHRTRERDDNSSDRLFVSQSSARESDVDRRNRLGGYMQPTVEDEDLDAMNGNVSEEDAVARAMRESMEPANLPQTEVAQSTEGEGGQRAEADVAQSTEEDEDDDDGEGDDEVREMRTDRAWRAASVPRRTARSESHFSNE